MSQLTLATLAALLGWIALIAYAVLGGADFGGGIWDLFARGRTAARERSAIAGAMGPVWESNNIWLIFVLVITWTAFPIVYASVSTALFIPITFALIGIVLRGASFSFRSHYGMRVGAGVAWGHVFSTASIITPFLLGTVAGALAGGMIHVSGSPAQVQANLWTTWTTPFALACGAFAVALCAVLAATYLTVDSHNNGDLLLAERFRQRAIIAGAVTAAVGVLAAVLSSFQAPVLWHGLIGKALPFSLGAILLGLATAVALLRNAYAAARILVAAGTVFIFAAWGVAQWPYFIVPDVTVDNAASPSSVLGPLLIVALLGLILVLPVLWYLFSIFKGPGTRTGPATGPHATTASFVASLQPASTSDQPSTSAMSAAPVQPSSVSGGAVRQQVIPVLAFSLAVAAATFITALYDAVRNRAGSRSRHSRTEAPSP
ncbi:MAG: Cytochrome d ubiquinol oxidase subunit II [Ktedonobacterales bacterium]|jgi:cytochrome d ubiquinol oxidase subunit II|nr:MAG: Cytochrome d ubiquinol oxidase subunit II [Ktedonobacterales bacterium]